MKNIQISVDDQSENLIYWISELWLVNIPGYALIYVVFLITRQMLCISEIHILAYNEISLYT